MPIEQMKNRKVLVGIRIDSHSRDLLSWALVKVAEPGDSVIAIHVCRNAGNPLFPLLISEPYGFNLHIISY